MTDRKSNLNWPVQQRPPNSAQNLWASALQHLHTNGTLHKPLTGWISYPHEKWFWYFDPSNHTLLYNPEKGNWQSTTALKLSTSQATRLSLRKKYDVFSLTSSGSADISNLLPMTLQKIMHQDRFVPLMSSKPLPIVNAGDKVHHSSLLDLLWSHKFY